MANYPEFTVDAYVDALTRLPDYGGYEALASGLSRDFPEAKFTLGPVGAGREGIRYEGLPIGGGFKQAGPLGFLSGDAIKRVYSSNPNNMLVRAYPAIWPTLSRLTSSPAPNVGIELAPERYDILPTGGDLYEGKPSDDAGGKEHKGAVGEHLAWEQTGLGQDGSGQLPSAVPITQDKQRELANELEEQQKALSAPALAVSNPSVDLGAERYDIPQQIQTIRSAPVATDAGMVATQRVRPQVDPAGNIDLVEPPQPVTGQQVTARTTQNFQPEPVVGKVTDPIVASLPVASSVAPAFDQARTQPADTLPSVYDTDAISLDIPAASGRVDDPLSLFEPYTIDDTGSAGISNVPQSVIDEAPLLDYVGDPVEDVPFVIEGDYTPSPPSMADPELPAPIPVAQPMVQAPPVLADPEVATAQPISYSQPQEDVVLAGDTPAAGSSIPKEDYHGKIAEEAHRAGIDFTDFKPTKTDTETARHIADQQALAKEELPEPQPGWEEAKRAELEAGDKELQAGLEEFLEEQAIVDPGLTQVNLPDDSGITDTAMPVDDTVVTDDLVLDKPVAEELPLPTTAGVGIEGGTGLPKEPETNLKATVTNTPLTEVVPEGTSATAEPIDLTAAKRTLDDGLDLRERLAGRGKGWADSGEWGYARTRNLLTGGGQAPVVTQGPLVPWQSMGEDASSTRYLSNVGDRDYFPSRLAPGERLGETTAAGEIDYVPEGQREGWNQPVIINQIHPGVGDGAGEPGSPMNKYLEDLSDDNSFKDIPGGLTDIPMISLKAQAGINDLRANYDINTLKEAKNVEGLANILSGGKAIAGKVGEVFTNLLGISDSDVKSDGFWNKMTTPIEAISTKEFGITPLDIALVVAGGAPAIGTVLMGKLASAIFKPITGSLSGMFDTILGGNKVEFSADTSTEASQKAVSDIQSVLKGLGQNSYAISKGTLYGPSGNVLGSNMQSVTFDAAGNSTFAGDIRIGPNDTVLWSDPGKGGTGKIWINGEDTGKVAIKDNNGEIKIGDSETSGASVPTKKEGPTTSVPVVGVSTISTVISGPGSRRDRDDEEEDEEEKKKDKG